MPPAVSDTPVLSSTPAMNVGDPPFARIDGDRAVGVLFLCDHACARVPPAYGNLGLSPETFERHIAYDIGTKAMTRRLAARSGGPALLTRFTRLLIDPNRGEDDPTLVMRLSDGALVPGNARIDSLERAKRIERFHRPYHAAIEAELDAMIATGIVPAIVSMHSFTPAWKGRRRPWHVGVLWDADPRLSRALVGALSQAGDIIVGDNEPYDGALRGDTLFRHGTARGLAHTLVELRQDLIATRESAEHWADRLWDCLEPLLADPHVHRIEAHPSRTGAVPPIPDYREFAP